MPNDYRDLMIANSRWPAESVQYSFLSATTLPSYYYDASGPNGFATWYANPVIENDPRSAFTVAQKNAVYYVFEAVSSSKITSSYAVDKSYRVSYADAIEFTITEKTSGVADITFVNANLDHNSLQDGDLTIGWAWWPSTNDQAGDVLIDTQDGSNSTRSSLTSTFLEPGSEEFWLHLHETLHTFGGLNDYAATSLINSAYNNMKYSAASYNPYGDLQSLPPQDGPIPAGGTWIYAHGLMLFDIAAIQEQYGSTSNPNQNLTTRSGDTIYKLGYGLGFYDNSFTNKGDPDRPFLYTIWDGGGNDTVDASGFTVGAEIDLRAGYFSSIGVDGAGNAIRKDAGANTADPDPGNVAIAYGVVIENAIGTSYDDHLIGNNYDNYLSGGRGNDTIDGDLGFDVAMDAIYTAAYVKTNFTSVSVTAINKTSGDYAVEYDFITGPNEMDVLTGIERIAHAERQSNSTAYQAQIQNNSTIARVGDGYVVLWEGRSQGGKSIGIFGQVHDESGNGLGEFQVSTGGGSGQYDPRAIETNSGGFIVVWEQRGTGNYLKTFAKFYDSTGAATTGDIEVFKNRPTTDPQYNFYLSQEGMQDVAMLSGGKVIVVAEGQTGGMFNGLDVVAQVLNPDGTRDGEKFIINSTTSGYQRDPAVTALTNGNFVVTWKDTDSSYQGIYGRIFQANKAAVTGQFQINDTEYFNQYDADVAALTGGLSSPSRMQTPPQMLVDQVSGDSSMTSTDLPYKVTSWLM